jgi:membrane associated rhomboid family serine protease
MLLPIRTNIRPRRTPYANYALIAINVAVFLLTYGPHGHVIGFELVHIPVRHWAEPLMLTPATWRIWQFITYAFLHGSVLHIVGNMFFLYLFGNNVNDRLGHFWYTLFYLVGAVVSGVGHTLLSMSSIIPTLGASGAVAAVTGAYLVLFPQTLVTVVYWFFFIGAIEVPALYFIGFKMILFDNILYSTAADVAYSAHIAGYIYGIGTIAGLLATGVISGTNVDLWSMIRQWNRRRHYHQVVAGGYDPFTGTKGRKPVLAKEVDKTVEQRLADKQTREILNEINTRLSQRNLAAAADSYVQLMQIDSQTVLPRQALLDIANQLASDQRAAEAAWAYEQFLEHYGAYEHSEQVALMLGLLYSRYLHKQAEAVKYLQRAVLRLSDPNQLKMCREELAKLQD